MGNPASASFSRVGTAKRGVPAKTRLSGFVIELLKRCHALPLTGFHKFANLAFHQVTFQSADVTDVKLAIEMVSLMKEGAGQQFLASLFIKMSIHVLGANRDLAWSGDRLAELGNAQAAFILGMAAFGVNNLGIGKHQLGIRVFLESHIDNGETFRNADLRSRQPNAMRGIHRFEHVLDELLQLVIEDSYSFSALFQDGITKFYDGVDHRSVVSPWPNRCQ